MKTNWYQIDRRQQDGTLDRYDMVRAISLSDALKEHLGADYNDYTIHYDRIHGKWIATTSCPAKTSAHFVCFRAE